MEMFYEQLKGWVQENQLLRIEVVLKKIGRRQILGRIVQYNEESVLIYMDDTKTVENYLLNEIDNIVPIRKV